MHIRSVNRLAFQRRSHDNDGLSQKNNKAEKRHVWDLQPHSELHCNSLQGPASLSTKTAPVCITNYCSMLTTLHMHTPVHTSWLHTCMSLTILQEYRTLMDILSNSSKLVTALARRC